MQEHAEKYSQAFRTDKAKGWANSFWTKDFDSMAIKTMLRQLISKWGIMSVEMQRALESGGRSEDGALAYGNVLDADFVAPENSMQIEDNNTSKEILEKMLTCPKTGGRAADSTCSECDERNGCPAWE